MSPVVLHDVGMTVPVERAAAGEGAVEQLHHPHTLLQEPPGEDAVAGEACLDRIAGRRAVVGERAGRLAVEIEHARNRELHPCREFIAADPRGQIAVAGIPLAVAGVELGQQVGRRVARRRRDSRGRPQIAGWLSGAERRALEGGRQKPRAPVVGARLRPAARVGNRDERRQIFVVAAEGISDPCTEAGKAFERVAGGEKVFGLCVGAVLRRERMDEAHLVGELGEVWHQVGDHLAAVAPRPERPERLGELADRALERDRGCIRRLLTIVAIERRLVVPGVEVADRTGAEDDE